MSINHTPGPWGFTGGVGLPKSLIFCVAENNPESASFKYFGPEPICKVYGDQVVTFEDKRRSAVHVCSETAIANARLIAAAPDLLAALETVARDLNIDMPAETAAIVQSAIKKAKGE